MPLQVVKKTESKLSGREEFNNREKALRVIDLIVVGWDKLVHCFGVEFTRTVTQLRLKLFPLYLWELLAQKKGTQENTLFLIYSTLLLCFKQWQVHLTCKGLISKDGGELESIQASDSPLSNRESSLSSPSSVWCCAARKPVTQLTVQNPKEALNSARRVLELL